VGENSPTGQMLSMGLEQAKRMTKIVAQLRQLTDAEREDAGQRFDLARAARAALGLYDKALREKGIVLETRFDEVLPPAQGDPAQIEQVIGALVDNAIAAMPPGGKLKLALSAVQGEALRLDVEDNGRGIPKRLQERIFDPFFTTKTDPAGVGLGLSLSHRIIERHQGKLLVESDEGEGTRFTVLLPAAGEAAHLY
ncbi:MAG TPA: HAMP domain-containing sensor histidine kinase, partial [Myxococcaceae bacterium]|nr:HAMP domain-containing sensor histidine kinase [Myxococcaceae bacterium]